MRNDPRIFVDGIEYTEENSIASVDICTRDNGETELVIVG